MSIISYSFLLYCTEMFSTLQSGLADLCWLWSCWKGLFFVQLMFSDYLQVINSGVLNMYGGCFLSISIFCEYECVWSFIHCMKSDVTVLMKAIGLVVSTFIGVPPSCECQMERSDHVFTAQRRALLPLNPLRIPQGFKSPKPSKWWWLRAVWCVSWYSSPLRM